MSCETVDKSPSPGPHHSPILEESTHGRLRVLILFHTVPQLRRHLLNHHVAVKSLALMVRYRYILLSSM